MTDKTKTWHLYVLLCQGGSLYTGVSPDPAARWKAHLSGRGAAYTRMHKPLAMLYCRRAGNRGQALRLEIRFKKLSRLEKIRFLKSKGAEI